MFARRDVVMWYAFRLVVKYLLHVYARESGKEVRIKFHCYLWPRHWKSKRARWKDGSCQYAPGVVDDFLHFLLQSVNGATAGSGILHVDAAWWWLQNADAEPAASMANVGFTFPNCL